MHITYHLGLGRETSEISPDFVNSYITHYLDWGEKLSHVDERAPAVAVAEERGKSARALRWIDPETRSTDLDVLV